MSVTIQSLRARIYAFGKLVTMYPDFAEFLRNGTIPDNEQVKEDFEILENEYFGKADADNKSPLSFTELCSFNTWFVMHPEKVAGKEVLTTSRMFPITIKGTKDDILKAIKGENQPKAEPKQFKEPVLRYKPDGNTLTNSKVVFEPILNLKNAYKTIEPTYVDKYNQNKYYDVIIKIEFNNKTAYTEVGNFPIERINSINQSDIDSAIKSLIDDITYSANDIRFINTLRIELAKQFNLDTNHLERIRAKFFEKKEQDELKQKAERIERENIETEKRKVKQLEKLKEALSNLKNSNEVDGETLIDLAKHFNIIIHPRTISAIRKYDMSFAHTHKGSTDYITYRYKSKKKVTINTDFINELLKQSFNNKTQPDWLFIGVYPTGEMYADRRFIDKTTKDYQNIAIVFNEAQKGKRVKVYSDKLPEYKQLIAELTEKYDNGKSDAEIMLDELELTLAELEAEAMLTLLLLKNKE